MRGTSYLSACRQTCSDCGSTPSLPSNTATAPSSTRRRRSTSPAKTTCPGGWAIVRKGSVCLGHLVGVLASLDGGTQAIAGIQDLACQPLDHVLLATLLGEADQPAQCQRDR